ncbi:MAG TPA: hypothetical protein VKS79_01340 [Gemmataceae bacterium]|nr:hypothetical protein [Gemmataceae bacterium]
MMIITCPICKTPLHLPNNSYGKGIRCCKCNTVMIVRGPNPNEPGPSSMEDTQPISEDHDSGFEPFELE